MRKLIALALIINGVVITCVVITCVVITGIGLTPAQATEHDGQQDGAVVVSAGIARQPFDRIDSSAPVRKPPAGEDVFTGE